MNKINYKILNELDLNNVEISLISTIIYNIDYCENTTIISTIAGDIIELKYNFNSNEINVYKKT